MLLCFVVHRLYWWSACFHVECVLIYLLANSQASYPVHYLVHQPNKSEQTRTSWEWNKIKSANAHFLKCMDSLYVFIQVYTREWVAPCGNLAFDYLLLVACCFSRELEVTEQHHSGSWSGWPSLFDVEHSKCLVYAIDICESRSRIKRYSICCLFSRYMHIVIWKS